MKKVGCEYNYLSRKGSFIRTIPQTGYHFHGFVVGLGQEWKQLNGSTMRDRSDNPLISLPFTVQVIGVRARARACVTGKHIIECVYNLHLIRRYQFIFNLILDYNPQI